MGDKVDLSAKQNLINLGGKIEAVKDLSLYAGKNLEISATLSSSQSADGNFARTVLDQLASVKVTGEGGRLTLHSDDNLTIKAANIESEGTLTASADKTLNITTLNVSNKEHYNGNADNYYRLDQQGEIGSTLRGKDDVRLVGMENATLRQATVSNENGETFIGSKGDVRIESGEQSEQLASSSKGSTKGWFSKTTETRRHYHDTTENIGSEIDGKNVTLYSEAGKVDIHGSAVVADKQLLIDSKEGVNITSATNTHYAEDEHIKTKSGLMGTGGIGFSVGKKKEQIEQDHTQQSAARSQVGSLSGDTIIRTDGHYQQTGSVVTSRDGDVDITAKSANITAARSDYESNYKHTMEQKGLTIALTGAVVSAIQAVDSTLKSSKTVGDSKNNRINAMAAANTGFEAMRAADQIMKIDEALSNGSATGGAVGISITYGQQKSVQTQHSEGNTAEKSQINAGGKVNIQTTGAGKDSHITIAGSDVAGLGGTHLKADGKVSIEAADENHLERSKNKSSGFNVGVAIQFGNGVSAGITAGGNVAKGYDNGESQAWIASKVGDKNSTTTIESGSDTNIIGSQVRGKRVELTTENLNIQSLQDTAKYKGKQESVQGQVTVGYGFSASGSYNKSKANSNYAGVKTQAGIFAGDEGYDVDIRNHTDLKGGTITSTEQAEQDGKNQFATNTLTYQDIYNHSDYSAKGFGLNGGFSVSGGEAPKEIAGVKLQQIGENHRDGSSKVEISGVAGAGSQGNWGVAKLATSFLGQVSDKGSESGITTASINTKNITIRDEQAQQQLTGKTAEEAIKEINKTNLHQEVNKVDIEQIKGDVERDLTTATDFVKNLHERGDEIYYRMEKNEDSVFSIQKKIEDCNHISCLDFKADNSQELKRIIYGDKILTDEQAQPLSKVATAGMLNLKRKDKVSSAILYDKDLASIDETAVILNRGSAGVVNEFIFTGFERFRAWANLPGIFGASNATRDHAQINKKLDEYNVHQIAQGKAPINANSVAHSLGVSGNKNMLNWSEYIGNEYKNTKINFLHLGGSYPSAEIDKQAKERFGSVNTEYHGVKGDFVYSGLRGLFIGNNPNAKQVERLGLGEAHSEANQNINNLKYVYDKKDNKERKQWEKAEDTLNKVYPNSGIREFNKVNEVNK